MQEPITINARQGDDITLTMQPVADGLDTSMLRIDVGLWNTRGQLAAHFSTGDGTVVAQGDGTYRVLLLHQLTKHLTGRILVEITASLGNGVSHADRKLAIIFEPRYNNRILCL